MKLFRKYMPLILMALTIFAVLGAMTLNVQWMEKHNIVESR